MADVDAITLSMAELSRGGDLEPLTASRAIVLAAMANTLVKGGLVVALGGRGCGAPPSPSFWPSLQPASGSRSFADGPKVRPPL